jgi:hypothetical protein
MAACPRTHKPNGTAAKTALPTSRSRPSATLLGRSASSNPTVAYADCHDEDAGHSGIGERDHLGREQLLFSAAPGSSNMYA